MEAKLNTIEAMFAKTEADLNYAMRRLDDENARADEDDQVGAWNGQGGTTLRNEVFHLQMVLWIF